MSHTLAVLLLALCLVVGLVLVPLGLPGLWVMVGGVVGYGALTGFRTIGIATMRKRRRIWQGLPSTKPLVSITRDRALRSRVTGNGHARFWIGGGGSNPVADHTQCITILYPSTNKLTVSQLHSYDISTFIRVC